MSDLTERLRAHRHMGKLAREAADRIDELETHLNRIIAQYDLQAVLIMQSVEDASAYLRGLNDD